jgi:RNA polymerase sigma factor
LLLVLFKKFLGNRQSSHSSEEDSETIEDKVIRIQQGDIRLRNEFITDYQPYVAKLTSQFCKRYVDPERDDEFSIALSAFNESVNQFSTKSGGSFFGFAQTVIRRRLIDHVRKEQRHLGQVPMSSFETEDDEDQIVNPIERHQAIEQYEKEKLIEERRLEIDELNHQLSEYGVSFYDLIDASPKHVDSRMMLSGIGKKLAEEDPLMDILLKKKMLPIKDLLERMDVSRKTLERNRKYIIAIALIFHGSYPYLKDFLHNTGTPQERSGEK